MLNVKVGDVVQVINQSHDWYACLLIVDEVKSWGVQAGMRIPYKGNTFIRLMWNDIAKVGRSAYTFGDDE